MKRTILDGAADNSLLILAISPGLSGWSLDVGTTPAHPQLEGEMVTWQCGHDRIRHRCNMIRPVEGEDQRWIRRGKSGQSSSPVGCRRWRWEEVYFTPDGTWVNYKGKNKIKDMAWIKQILSHDNGFRYRVKLTTQAAYRSVRVAVSVTALPNVASLELYGGLDVPHRLFTSLQMQAGEQRDASWPWCVFYTLCPSLGRKNKIKFTPYCAAFKF